MPGKAVLRGLLWLLLFVSPVEGRAQYFSNYDANKDLFIRNVKLIDEFIERFNDDKHTYLRKALAADDSQYSISRGMLLVSLFNLENTSFTDKDTLLKGFFRRVLDKDAPVYLSFNDTDWYAAAQCVFLFKGRLVEIPVVLRVRSKGDEWAKWMIAGIGKQLPGKGPAPSVSVSNKDAKMPAYISTSAYATNFVELHYVFTKNIEPELVFEKNLLASEEGQAFISLVRDGSLRFQYAKKVTFHFFQVKDWLFTVDEFKRKAYNNGWLISSMRKVTDSEKEAARRLLIAR